MPPKGSRKRSKSKAAPAKKKLKVEESSESEEETSVIVATPVKAQTTPVKKTPDEKKKLSPASQEELQRIYGDSKSGKITPSEFGSLTVNDLKYALKFNDRSTTGNRGDLVSQVIIYMTSGVPPRCPDCGGGRLRFGKYKDKKMCNKSAVWCPGYMEDDEFVNCAYTANTDDVTVGDWKDPE